MRLKADAFDRANSQIRDLAAQHATLEARLSALQAHIKHRGERGTRIANLRRSLEERRKEAAKQGIKVDSIKLSGNELLRAGDFEKLEGLDVPATSVPGATHPNDMQINGDVTTLTTVIDPSKLPDLPTLRARLAAYSENNDKLRTRSRQLKSRSAELESMYRKVIALCTGTDERMVDEALPSLLQALESDSIGPAERVSEFLRKVEGAGLAAGAVA